MKTKVLFIILFILCSLTDSTVTKGQNANISNTVFVCYEGSRSFPPYEFINDDGKPDGFNVDLIGTMFKRLNVSYCIKLKEWHDVLSDLDVRKNVVACLMYSNERNKKYIFGSTLKYTDLYAVYDKNRIQINSLEDFKGRKVVVEQGALSNELMKERKNVCNLFLVPHLDIGLVKLSKGEYDVMLCENEAAEYYIKKFGLDNLKVKDIGVRPHEICFAGNDSEIQNIMELELYKMKQDGTYDKIYDKWFDHESKLSQVSKIIYFVILILLFIVIVLYFFVHILRHRVNKVKKMLLENNEKLKLALSAGKIKVVGFDVKKNVFYNIEGELIQPEGRYMDEQLSYFHPDDRALYTDTINNAIIGILPESSLCFRVRYSKSNDWRYIEKEISVIRDDKGLVTNIIGTFKDITEQKMHEERVTQLNAKINEYALRIRYVLKESHILTWYYDLATDKITLYTEDVKLYKTLTSEEYISLCEPDVQDEVRKNYQVAMKNKLEKLYVQRKMSLNINGDKESYYVINGISIKNADGIIVSYFGICNDVTNLINIQKRLEEEKQKAQESDKLKSVFLANMSHEIRTPLNSIVGFSNLLESVNNEEDKDMCIKLINKNSEVLLGLINDILDFSKLEAGMMDLHMTVFNLSDLFNVTYYSLQELTKEKDIKFKCELPQEPYTINSDYNRVVQILTNFVTNAFKYTEHGYVTMSYVGDENGVTMIVEDTGIGIPKDKMDLVFQRFEKIGSLRQGTGLGLSICKAIIDMLKGKIGVDSEEGKGSRFWAWLPNDIKLNN